MDGQFDCCVLDLRLPDMSGFELLEEMQTETASATCRSWYSRAKTCRQGGEPSARRSPRASCSGRPISRAVVRRDGPLPASRRVRSAPDQARLLERLHARNEALVGRKVLIVDDDARNIFALATVLENQEMEVITATNGRQAIELIQNTSDLDVVLMDIMMPEMDGYETMRAVRQFEKRQKSRNSADCPFWP